MMQRAVTSRTQTANPSSSAKPPEATSVNQAGPAPVSVHNQAMLRLQRKCDCGGGPACDCDMANDKTKKEKDSPRTALHRKASGAASLLDAATESFFEARARQRASASSGPPIQIGAANDPLEREADQIADRVMQMPLPAALPTHQPTAAEAANPLQRKPESAASPTEAPPIVHNVLSSPGQPLDRPTRNFFEPRFGRDLSQVRIHNDSKASESAHAIDALAFASGNNIVFASGIYRPDRQDGRFILAHELVHTMQQARQQTIRRIIRSAPNAPLDSYLRGKSISGFTSSGGSYSKARGTQPTFSEQEVLLDMLASARFFEVAGDNSIDAEKSLNDHVAARLGIVTFASQKQYSFASVSGFKMNPKYWITDPNTQSYKLKPGVDKQAAWDDLNKNPQEYAIGCFAATDITQAGGAKGAQFRNQPSTDESDWVPGDAGYVSNPNHPKGADPGTLGENIIYTGSGQFWGHLSDVQTYRTLDEWKKVVFSWNNSSQVDSKRDGPVTGLA